MRTKYLVVIGLSVISLWAIAWLSYQRHKRDELPVLQDGPETVQVEVGDQLVRPDGRQWHFDAQRAIVSVTAGNCGACIENRDFEDELRSRASALGYSFFYMISSNSKQDGFAKDLEARGSNVLRGVLFFVGVSRTPTMLAIDRSGKVIAIWTGTVPHARKEETLKELIFGTTPPLYTRVTTSEVASWARKFNEYRVIALREPRAYAVSADHYQVIPGDELAIRAGYELPPQAAAFIDCKTAVNISECGEALLTLAKSAEHTQLFAIDFPRRRSPAQYPKRQ